MYVSSRLSYFLNEAYYQFFLFRCHHFIVVYEIPGMLSVEVTSFIYALSVLLYILRDYVPKVHNRTKVS